jgi:hypothetical protein
MKRLLTHAVATWAGGFVVLYWMLDHASRELDAAITRMDIFCIAAWPYFVVQYVWGLL